MAEIKGLVKNSDNIKFLTNNTKEMSGSLHVTGNVTVTGEVHNEKLKIVTFADGTDEEIAKMLKAHYNGEINISDYWNVGDVRKIHINEITNTTGGEKHVEQDIVMIIIGIDHDILKESIGKRTQAAITLQCRETLGNNSSAEIGRNFGGSGQYSNSQRRTWLNNIFAGSLPSTIQSLLKTVIKKNLANHSNSNAGIDTEDKVFLTSYSEMFGNANFSNYKGNEELEGKQYSYYTTDIQRKKTYNNNGEASNKESYYWLRSPSSYGSSNYWIGINTNGTANYRIASDELGIAPAFCL